MQKKFEKFELKRVEFFQKRFIKYREEKFIKKRFYNDEIVSMKLNFIDKFKDQEFKKRMNMLFLRKKKHFVKNYQSINVMNRRKLNVLQTKFVKKEFQKNVENESKFLKVITNNEYYRIKNVDEL